jgi:hypothetical protein
MKNWQFWLLLILIAVTLVIVIKIGTGLQSASTQVSSVTNSILGPVKSFFATKV